MFDKSFCSLNTVINILYYNYIICVITVTILKTKTNLLTLKFGINYLLLCLYRNQINV